MCGTFAESGAGVHSGLRVRQRFLKLISIAAFMTAVMISTGGSAEDSHGSTANTVSEGTAVRSERGKSVPAVLESALSEIKTRSGIPVLLPSAMPPGIGTVRHALIEKANSDGYQISLYYKLGVGDAGFAGMLSAQSNPGYTPQELPNVSEVELAHGIHGYFRAVTCGGSCSPANLWWKEGRVLYQVQFMLPSDYSDLIQQHEMVMAADSAILAGAR